MNFGLSKWYDLVNDPSATTDMAQNPYFSGPPREQGALFNNIVNPGDLIGHIGITGNESIPRSLSIIENTPERVIIDCSYSPILNGTVNVSIVFTERYYIYPDGKIYIKHRLQSSVDQTLSEWRNAIIGLGDPSFVTSGDNANFMADNNARTLTDTSKNWTTNQWVGYMATINYNQWAIVGNTSDTLQIGAKIGGGAVDTLIDGLWNIASRQDKFGWLRSTDTQNPYTWSNIVAKYIFEYWDPTTPAPYTNWTKASILMTPKAGNSYQGNQGLHEWDGFKRWFYRYYTIDMAAGQEITQQYFMQLGAQNSSILSNITSSSVANPYADDYLNPATLAMAVGTTTGFDTEEGNYQLSATSNQTQFSIDGSVYKRIKPAFRIENYNSAKIPTLTVSGQAKAFGTDFTAAKIDGTTLLVQLQNDLSTDANIDLAEGTQYFPDTDTLPPAAPNGLNVL